MADIATGEIVSGRRRWPRKDAWRRPNSGRQSVRAGFARPARTSSFGLRRRAGEPCRALARTSGQGVAGAGGSGRDFVGSHGDSV